MKSDINQMFNRHLSYYIIVDNFFSDSYVKKNEPAILVIYGDGIYLFCTNGQGKACGKARHLVSVLNDHKLSSHRCYAILVNIANIRMRYTSSY